MMMTEDANEIRSDLRRELQHLMEIFLHKCSNLCIALVQQLCMTYSANEISKERATFRSSSGKAG